MNIQSKFKILCICGDPGGAGALLPIIKALQTNKEIELFIFAYNESEIFFQKANIQYSSLNKIKTSDHIQNILINHKINLLLTATSVNKFNWETQFISIANMLTIKTVSILDFWSNYVSRFKNNSGSLVLPETIIVMDDVAKRQMLSLNFPEAKIKVLGSPVFDDIKLFQETFSQEKKLKILKKFNSDENDFFISFISQPICEFYGNQISKTYIGYTQHDVIKLLVKALEKIHLKKNITLLIRPHPREVTGYKINHNELNIHISSAEHSREILLSSDLVIGMNSVLLVEACLLGLPVISVQPNLLGDDMLPTNQVKASMPIYEEDEIQAVLENLILNPQHLQELKKLSENFTYYSNATLNIVNYLYDQLQREKSNASA